MRRSRALLMAVALAACSPAPMPARPALWEITGPSGERAWLFGTVHSLARPALWRTPPVDRALAQADTIMVELNDLGRERQTARIFAELARSPGHPPLSERTSPGLRDKLNRLLAESRLADNGFPDTETWAAALTLARARDPGLDPAHGVDRAVIAAADGREVIELEGAREQLRLFDELPEREQRDLLDAVVRDAGAAATERGDLAEAWRKGDMATIGREASRGMLADPELREALFTGRNRKWAETIAIRMSRGERPFVAVGAAHMAGPDGLPALLGEKGYRVARVQ